MSPQLKGKSCYVTGTIKGITKKEMRTILERKGMKWKKAVNGDLDFLITGSDPTPSKVELAKEIGIEVVSWDDFKSQNEL